MTAPCYLCGRTDGTLREVRVRDGVVDPRLYRPTIRFTADDLAALEGQGTVSVCELRLACMVRRRRAGNTRG